MLEDDEQIGCKRIDLAVEKAFSAIALDDHIRLVMGNFELQRYEDAVLQNIIRGLYRFLSKEEIEAVYPTDWWQAFKERWFPYWLLRRYPVRYTKIVAKHLFPEATVPNLGKEIIQVKKVVLATD